MLVLTRKKDQSIVINNDIKIVVVEIRGDKVRLGIEAPKEVPVHRHEVFDAIADTSATGEGADVEADSVSATLVSAATGASPDNATRVGGETIGEGSRPPLRPR